VLSYTCFTINISIINNIISINSRHRYQLQRQREVQNGSEVFSFFQFSLVVVL